MNTSTAHANLTTVVGSNWITGTVDGLLVQAKVYAEPSQYGMEQEPRISKLWVKVPGKGTGWDGVIYNYDRGLDIDHMNESGLAVVIAAIVKKIPQATR